MSNVKKNIVFIGFMGTGKTTVARELSKLIGYRFIDSDKMISNELGMTVEAIFETLGEETFRKVEKEIIGKISKWERSIISVGGGAVIDPENATNLKKNGIIILLNASPEIILSRVSKGESRPLLKERNVLGKITELLKEREASYKSYDYEVSVDNLPIEDVSNKVIKILRENKYI